MLGSGGETCEDAIFERNEILLRGSVKVMVFNASFNIISVASWVRQVLLVEEARENHWHAPKLLLRPPDHSPEWLLKNGLTALVRFLFNSSWNLEDTKKMYINQIKMLISFPYFNRNPLMGKTWPYQFCTSYIFCFLI